MEIAQFKYGADNLGYLVYGKSTGVAIDGGDPEGILAFAEKKGIEISVVTNTHSHGDHTPGNAGLLEKTGARFLDCRSFVQGQKVELGGGQSLEVLLTPGHTMDSICFKGEGFIVTGDTLFNGTVGNCFSGDLTAFFHSLKQLLALPGETRVYAGHNYVMESLKYARIIDPENPDLPMYESAYTSILIVSCIADELKVNPYLRFNAPAMIQRLEEKKLPMETEFQRFSAIMEIY